MKKINITDISAWCKIKFEYIKTDDFDKEYSNPLANANQFFVNDIEVTNLVIPDDVTTISDMAFYKCKFLTSITIPSSVTSVGEYAFANCKNLTSIYISDLNAWCNISFSYSSFQSVDAFHLYLSGEEVKDWVIPDGLTSIEKCAFKNCISLKSLTIPLSITSIGLEAFNGCSNLTNVAIPNSIPLLNTVLFRTVAP